MNQNQFDAFEQAFAREISPVISWSQALLYAATIFEGGFKYVRAECSKCSILPRRALSHIIVRCRTPDPDYRYWTLKEIVPYSCMGRHGSPAEALIAQSMFQLADDLEPVVKRRGWLNIQYTKSLISSLQPPHSTLVSITSRLIYAELENSGPPRASVDRPTRALARGFGEYLTYLKRYCPKQ